ncbi:hypothetical protein [Streptomyces sp. NPDC001933]
MPAYAEFHAHRSATLPGGATVTTA